MAVTFCSFCSREMPPDTTEYPFCGATFHTETLSLLTDDFPEPSEEAAPRRKHVRTPKATRVRTSADRSWRKATSPTSAWAVRPFIATDDPLNQGETMKLKIFLPYKGRELKVMGEVAWSSRQHEITPEKTHPPSMGVRSLHLSIEDRSRIGRNILAY